MLDFLKQNAIFLAVVFGTLLVIVIAYLLYTWKSKSNAMNHFKDSETPVNNPVDNLPDEQVELPEEKSSTQEELPVQDETTSVAETTEEEESTNDALKENLENTLIPLEVEESQPLINEEQKEPDVDLNEKLSMLETKIVSSNSDDSEPSEDESFESNEDSFDDEEGVEDFSGEAVPEKKELGKYHIIFRQMDKMWIIKREGSHKVIKALHTQNEAIAYATIKSIKQKTTYVIHKRDGKIRKQNY